MNEPMFHKRRPGEGAGYGIASRKGAAVVLGFVVTVMALPLGMAVYFEGQEWSVYVAGAMVFAMLFGFIWFVMRHSDADQG